MGRMVLGSVCLLLLAASGMQGQGAKPEPATPLEKTEWRLVWLGTMKIESAAPQQAPYLQLDPGNHRLSGSGGCNRLMGAYEVEGNHLKFTEMAITAWPVCTAATPKVPSSKRWTR